MNMIRLAHPPRHSPVDIAIPLINVVLLLLIFLMLTGLVRASDPIALNPAISDSRNEAQDAVATTVYIARDGAMRFGAATDKTSVLIAIAKAVKAGQLTALTVKADGGYDVSKILELSQSIRLLGVESLSLVVERRQ